MKQSLQLRIGQSLTMTPQLQQAIRLLQLSTLDLQAEVQELVESNPMLEVEEGDEGRSSNELELAGEPAEQVNEFASLDGSSGEAPVSEQPKEVVSQPEEQLDRIPDDLPVDSNWDDVYDSMPAATSGSRADDGASFEAQGDGAAESLQDHLQWQLDMQRFSDTDRVIGGAIIDAINEDGYLSASLESIWEGLREELDVDLDEVEAVLRRVHSFDPVGVGARDLRECLLIQLKQYDGDPLVLNRAKKLVSEYLDMLAGRDFTQVMRRMKLDKEQLQDVIVLIQSLNPRPGTLIASSQAEYVVPDVVVKKNKDRWLVELNAEAMPRLRINSMYANLVKRADNSTDNVYLKNNLQEARWFLKSLQSRNETLLKVATCIVERQQGFLEHGEEAMKALVLHDVAEAVGMHESTISRVTTQKYMHTPRGIFELKYFFSSHVTTATGGACSATAIRALIKKLIAAENVQKPLSDSKLAGILEEQGINVARRTVAKYRESMSIPPSNERKRLA